MLACRSPWLFAACRVLLRLLVARHPPYALFRLIVPCLLRIRAAWHCCLFFNSSKLYSPRITFKLLPVSNRDIFPVFLLSCRVALAQRSFRYALARAPCRKPKILANLFALFEWNQFTNSFRNQFTSFHLLRFIFLPLCSFQGSIIRECLIHLFWRHARQKSES